MAERAMIHILGAGPAGLAIGHYAKKNNISFEIYESSDQVGGNCKTIVDGEFRFDTGAHRFHDKNNDVSKEINSLMGDELQKIQVPSKIYRNGRMIDFPLNFSSIKKNLETRIILKIIYENFFNLIRYQNKPTNFKDLAYKNYGRTLSELFLTNYTSKLWGEDPSQLQTDIAGGRLKDLNLYSLFEDLILHNSYSRHLDGSFLYPKYGFGTIFNKMAENMGFEKIKLKSTVKEIFHDGNRIKKIIYGNNIQTNVENIVNTLPINILLKILNPAPPKHILEAVNDFSFRNLRLCIFFLNVPYFSPNASIYFPDRIYPFTRIYEPKNRSAKMAPKDKTCIVVELPYSIGDNISSMSDEDNLNTIKSILVKENFLKYDDVISCRLLDINNAYPVLTVDKEKRIKQILTYLDSFENQVLIGRNAEFKYLHTHDIISKAKMIIEELKIKKGFIK